MSFSSSSASSSSSFFLVCYLNIILSTLSYVSCDHGSYYIVIFDNGTVAQSTQLSTPPFAYSGPTPGNGVAQICLLDTDTTAGCFTLNEYQTVRRLGSKKHDDDEDMHHHYHVVDDDNGAAREAEVVSIDDDDGLTMIDVKEAPSLYRRMQAVTDLLCWAIKGVAVGFNCSLADDNLNYSGTFPAGRQICLVQYNALLACTDVGLNKLSGIDNELGMFDISSFSFDRRLSERLSSNNNNNNNHNNDNNNNNNNNNNNKRDNDNNKNNYNNNGEPNIEDVNRSRIKYDYKNNFNNKKDNDCNNNNNNNRAPSPPLPKDKHNFQRRPGYGPGPDRYHHHNGNTPGYSNNNNKNHNNRTHPYKKHGGGSGGGSKYNRPSPRPDTSRMPKNRTNDNFFQHSRSHTSSPSSSSYMYDPTFNPTSKREEFFLFNESVHPNTEGRIWYLCVFLDGTFLNKCTPFDVPTPNVVLPKKHFTGLYTTNTNASISEYYVRTLPTLEGIQVAIRNLVEYIKVSFIGLSGIPGLFNLSSLFQLFTADEVPNVFDNI